MAAELSQAASWRDEPLVTNVRHVTLLEQARDALRRCRLALASAGGALPEEFLLADIQEAQDACRRSPDAAAPRICFGTSSSDSASASEASAQGRSEAGRCEADRRAPR